MFPMQVQTGFVICPVNNVIVITHDFNQSVCKNDTTIIQLLFIISNSSRQWRLCSYAGVMMIIKVFEFADKVGMSAITAVIRLFDLFGNEQVSCDGVGIVVV